MRKHSNDCKDDVFSTALDKVLDHQGTPVCDCVILTLGINLSAKSDSKFLNINEFSSMLEASKSVCQTKSHS